MASFNMGSKIFMSVSDPETGEKSWENGTVLGIHDGVFDILLANGDGKMNVHPDELKLDENAEVEEQVVEKKTVKSTIGWNPGAFGDEAEEVVDDENPPVEVSKPKKGGSGGAKFSAGDLADIKDHAKKCYRAVKLTEVDEELGTVSAVYEDTGEEGKGIPLSLVRIKKDRKKKSQQPSEKNGGHDSDSVGIIGEITAILQTLSPMELSSTLEIVRQIKCISSASRR